MPTFHSIPLHPSIQNRLLQAQPVPISTPHAVLTRTPNAVGEALMLCSNNNDETAAAAAAVEELRYQVACALIPRTTVTGQYISIQQKRNRILSLDAAATTIHGQKRSRPFLSGVASITAADQQLALIGRMATMSGEQVNAGLLSGCAALDRLIAFPDEWMMPLHASSSSSGGTPPPLPGGLPPGHVLSIVGPSASGKTQLALQLALQHARTMMQTTTKTNNIVRYLASSAGQGGTLVDLALRCQSLLRNKTKTDDSTTTSTSTTTGSTNSNRVKRKRGKPDWPAPELPSNLYFQPIAMTSDLALVLSQVEQELEEQHPHTTTSTLSSSSSSYCTTMIVVDSMASLVAHAEDPDASMERILQWLKRLARWQHRAPHLSVVVVGGNQHHNQQQQHHHQQFACNQLQRYSDVQLSLCPLLSSASTLYTTTTTNSATPTPNTTVVQVRCTKHCGQVVPSSDLLQKATGAIGTTGSSTAKLLQLGLSSQGLQEMIG